MNFAKLIVADNQKCVNIFLKLFNSCICLCFSFSSFKSKRNRNNCYGKNTHVACNPCDDWRCTGSCSTTHSGSDKNHFGILIQYLTKLFHILNGCFLSNFRNRSCSTAFSQAWSKLYFCWYRTNIKSLMIGVAHQKIDSFYSQTVHVIYSIAAASTYTNHFNDRWSFFW
ncbi:MAG: hypothetical protein BWY67_02394 [Bacteroidetes bacterium ADurb.Bin397]|nr:MAG: hypothetical protein BWY67_02394 [Bacteroidetes bacterium ADurb.Bin397]